mmetsp:Transcript_7702/g.47662  ORF Transcript_7702/g.47662 Transcript_7702/m.47662 type:complete len:90 (-) Transcript_7702:924-1193(-)
MGARTVYVASKEVIQLPRLEGNEIHQSIVHSIHVASNRSQDLLSLSCFHKHLMDSVPKGHQVSCSESLCIRMARSLFASKKLTGGPSIA